MTSVFKGSCFFFWMNWVTLTSKQTTCLYSEAVSLYKIWLDYAICTLEIVLILQLVCLSYLLGTFKFINNHLIYDQVMADNIYLMHFVCVFSIIISFVGCFFLKCDINNVCCALIVRYPFVIYFLEIFIW